MRRFLILLLLAACSPNGSPGRGDSAATAASTARDSTADATALRALLDAWYAAMQAGDSTGTLAPLTPHFLLLEDTLPLSGPELFARLSQNGAGTKWSAAFSDWRTRFHGDVAWTTLRNHETSQGKDGKKCQADFLETIVFVRDRGRWFIDRYHAAALHPWTCER